MNAESSPLAQAMAPALEPDLLVEHPEAVAAAQVAREIEIPLQHVGHRVGELAVGSGALDRALERTRELARDGAHPRFAGVLPPGRLPRVGLPLERELALAFESQLEPGELAVLAAERRVAGARPQLAQVDIAGRGERRGMRLFGIETEVEQDVAERLAAAQHVLAVGALGGGGRRRRSGGRDQRRRQRVRVERGLLDRRGGEHRVVPDRAAEDRESEQAAEREPQLRPSVARSAVQPAPHARLPPFPGCLEPVETGEEILDGGAECCPAENQQTRNWGGKPPARREGVRKRLSAARR